MTWYQDLVAGTADVTVPPIGGRLSRSVWTIDHVYPVAARGFLDHLHRRPSDFDILSIGCLAGNAPVGGAKTEVSVFVDMADG